MAIASLGDAWRVSVLQSAALLPIVQGDLMIVVAVDVTIDVLGLVLVSEVAFV